MEVLAITLCQDNLKRELNSERFIFDSNVIEDSQFVRTNENNLNFHIVVG